jgi:iron(III) transport system substrate-binding protein
MCEMKRWPSPRILAAFALAFLFAASAAAEEPWQKEWAKTLDAARHEGVVFVSGPPGPLQRQAFVTGWQKAFPDIKIEYTAVRGTQILPNVVRERQSGLYNWDIIIASTDPTVFILPPINALAPLRDALIDPDVFDDKKWNGGFGEGFVDSAQKYFYSPMGLAAMNLGYVNRECVSDEAFNKSEDLKKPEFKGKVVTYDPLQPGIGSRNIWRLSVDKGMDWLKDLFQNHGVVFSRDYRQETEWLVGCRMPIALGIPQDPISQMQTQGIGKKLQVLSGPAFFGDHGNGWAGGNENLGIYNNAPHPNAAKLFVNWYLSQEGQQLYATLNSSNSRRLDTTPGDPNPDDVLKPGVKYTAWGDEASIVELRKVQEAIESWGIVK